MTPKPIIPLHDDDDEEAQKTWKHISLEQLSEKVDGNHKRMGGYIQGLRDAQSDSIRAIVDVLSKNFVSRTDLEYELEVIDERYGWVPKLLKWCGIAIGGGMLAAWLRQILK